MISLRFSNFWKTSSSVQNRFFLPLISSVYEDTVEIVRNPESKVDVEIFSVFPPKPSLIRRGLKRYGYLKEEIFNPLEPQIKSNSKKKVWFTGENTRPPIPDFFDAYLSYESNDYHPRNIYLPLWVLNLNLFGHSGAHGFTSINPVQEDLLKPRVWNEIGIENRHGCCAFIGVMENSRRNAAFEVSKITKMDFFGRSVGKPIQDKIEIASRYKFILAFENSIYPGYVSEKLLEAQLTNALPLYWGPERLNYFNPDSYLNLSNFSSLDEFAEEIRRLDENEDELIHRLTQPLLLNLFDFKFVIRRLKELLLG